MPVFNKMVYNGTEYILGGGGNIGEPVLSANWTNNSVTIRWTDGDDINTIPPSTFDHAVLVRKIGSAPTSPSDGDIVETETVKNTYSSIGFTDTGLTTGTSYFYNVFCYSTTGGISYGTPVEATPGVLEWPDIDRFSLTISGVYSGAGYNQCSIAVSNDGSIMFIGRDQTTMTQHTLTNGDLINYDSTATSTLSGYQSRGLWCKPDGTILYDSHDNGDIYVINMSTPYSLSGATVDSYNVGYNCCGIGLNYDGTKLYHGSWGTSKTFYEYNLSTPFDVSTRGTGIAHTVNAISASIGDSSYIFQIAVSPSGKKMYFSADQGVIYQYNLSTPYDWSTATYYGSFNTGTNKRITFSFRADGERLYTGLVLDTQGRLYQYDAS